MANRGVRSAALALLAALLVMPAAWAGGAPAKAAKPDDRCRDGVFCAGAATGDITPPITSPQFAYTLRHCAAATPVEIASHAKHHAEHPDDHVEEGQAWLLSGGASCPGAKAGPDTDLYAKTYPPSEGTYGRLQANAFVLQDRQGERVAIVQADLGGIPGELHTAVARRLDRLGITRDRLLISATHTHGSVGGIWHQLAYAMAGGDAYDPRIFEAVVTGVTDAVVRAAGNLRASKLGVGFGEIQNANGNRRREAFNLNPEAKAGIDKADATRLMVMRLDTVQGVPIGVVTNFANHGVIHGTFNFWLSGDNQGTTTRRVARGIRAAAEASGVKFPKNWQVVDALINGAPGDITPRSDDGGWTYEQYGYDDSLDNGPPFQEFARFENAGMRQAPEALRIWESLAGSMTDQVDLDARLDFVCFCGQSVGNDPHDQYDWEAEPTNDDPAYRSTSVQAILGTDDGSKAPFTIFPGHHREIPRVVSTYPGNPQTTRVGVVRINDLALVTMPGEPTIQMGRRIERSVVAASGGTVKNAVTVGLANDYASYMATIHEYEAYRYEGTFSLFGQQTGNLLKERLVGLTALMRDGRPVPPCTRERNCLEPPDTSGFSTKPRPLVPDLGVGQVLEQPVSGERLDGTRFRWTGGSPSSEWALNDPMVEVQRQEGKRWVTVASDLDPEVPLHYDKAQGTNRWTAYLDTTKDWQVGRYRFHVTGHKALAPDTVTDYVLDSAEFTIAPSTALSIAKNNDGSFSVVHPAPDAAVNYRYRERVAETATVTVAGVVYPATFRLPPGQELVVPPGAIEDAWHNTNGSEIRLTA